MKGDMGVISIREDIVLSGKRNFIIAHEIAHFCLHKSLLTVFSDTHKTLSDWYKNGPQEREANAFASAFLMPEDLFVKIITGEKLNIDLIKNAKQKWMAQAFDKIKGDEIEFVPYPSFNKK